MTPPTVNAYYNPPQNNINFPAGILQPPFFDNEMDPAVNFGGIGVVIGHEMTHGFDDQGSKYDLHGNVRVWWTPEDLAKFNERTECEAKEYDGFEVSSGPEPERASDAGREYGGQWRTADCFPGADGYAGQGGHGCGTGIYATASATVIHRRSASSLALDRFGARTQTEQSSRVLAKTDPHSPGHCGPTEACRTSTSSARRLAARLASR